MNDTNNETNLVATETTASAIEPATKAAAPEAVAPMPEPSETPPGERSAVAADEREKIGERLRAIEELLPDFLKARGARAVRQEHPAGEAFFRGDAEEVTDAEAEEIARKQLERSGLLRGQKVRVGD